MYSLDIPKYMSTCDCSFIVLHHKIKIVEIAVEKNDSVRLKQLPSHNQDRMIDQEPD